MHKTDTICNENTFPEGYAKCLIPNHYMRKMT